MDPLCHRCGGYSFRNDDTYDEPYTQAYPFPHDDHYDQPYDEPYTQAYPFPHDDPYDEPYDDPHMEGAMMDKIKGMASAAKRGVTRAVRKITNNTASDEQGLLKEARDYRQLCLESISQKLERDPNSEHLLAMQTYTKKLKTDTLAEAQAMLQALNILPPLPDGLSERLARIPQHFIQARCDNHPFADSNEPTMEAGGILSRLWKGPPRRPVAGADVAEEPTFYSAEQVKAACVQYVHACTNVIPQREAALKHYARELHISPTDGPTVPATYRNEVQANSDLNVRKFIDQLERLEKVKQGFQEVFEMLGRGVRTPCEEAKAQVIDALPKIQEMEEIIDPPKTLNSSLRETDLYLHGHPPKNIGHALPGLHLYPALSKELSLQKGADDNDQTLLTDGNSFLQLAYTQASTLLKTCEREGKHVPGVKPDATPMDGFQGYETKKRQKADKVHAYIQPLKAYLALFAGAVQQEGTARLRHLSDAAEVYSLLEKIEKPSKDFHAQGLDSLFPDRPDHQIPEMNKELSQSMANHLFYGKWRTHDCPGWYSDGKPPTQPSSI